MGHKKVKLIFSTILIVFSLISFGIMLSAYSSDVNTKTLELFAENGATDVSISQYSMNFNYIEMMNEVRGDIQNYDELMDKYSPIDIDENFEKEVHDKTGLEWNKVYKIDSPSGETQMVFPESLQNEDNMPIYFYIGNYALNDLSFMEVDKLNFDKIIGKIPENDDEIMISNYLADCIIYRGCIAKDTNDDKIDGKKYVPQNYNELVNSGKYINILNISYMKIVGIIDESDKLNEFAKIKTTKASYLWNSNESELGDLYNRFYEIVSKEEATLYVNSSYINKMKNVPNTRSAVKTKIEYDGNKYISQEVAYINKELSICDDAKVKKITTLNENEIVIDEGTLGLITNYDYNDSYEINKNKYDSKEEFLIKYLKDNSIIGKTIKTNVNQGKVVDDQQEYVEYKIVGVYFSEMLESANSTVYYSKNVVEPLISGKVHCKSLLRRVESLEDMKKIISIYPLDNSDKLSSSRYSEKVLEANSTSYLLSFVSKYGVAFFLVFASMILMSFINSSIKFRKKEIGTLRALGCRSVDIIKMFLYESIILMLIALGIAFIIIPKITATINNFVITELLMNIEVLNFGTKQILQITGIMMLVVILANVIPVGRITKMKPIDAILNK